ncbi:MAG: hypothetical protein ACON5H_00820 [Akkermansiaceae bacterium]
MIVSAFPRAIVSLARQLHEAAVDHAAFEIPLPLCQLQECRATCCHDGVVVSDEEAEVLGEGVIELADGRKKTQTVEATDDQLPRNFPGHFPRTRCLFLDEQHRCRWQIRSMEEGKHPWFYKPISCWMHPLLVSHREGRPLLTVRHPESDETDFASYTPCGKLTAGAAPARITLQMELEMLAKISGRDFLSELNAPSI